MSSPQADDKRRNPYEDEPGGIPHWLKVSLIIVAVVALLVVVFILAGGGQHARRHAIGAGASVPPTVGTASFSDSRG